MPVSQDKKVTTDVKKEEEFDVLNAFTNFNQVTEKVVELDNGWKIGVRELYGIDSNLIFKLMVDAGEDSNAVFQTCNQALSMKYLEVDGKKNVYPAPKSLGELLLRAKMPLKYWNQVAEAVAELNQIDGNIEEAKK